MSDSGLESYQSPIQSTDIPEHGEKGAATGFTPHEESRTRTTALLAKFAHELRTSLSVVKGFAQLLQSELPDDTPESMREYVSMIVTHSAQIDRLIENVLAYDLAERGRLRFHLVPLDLVPFLKRSVSDCDGLLTEKALTLAEMLPEQPVMVVADEALLEQALRNLVAHAAQMAAPTTVLSLSLETREEHAVITLVDPVRTLDNARLALLFQPAWHVTADAWHAPDDARRAMRQMDLGLTVARSIVEAQGGRMEATSEENFGTTLSVYLPLERAE